MAPKKNQKTWLDDFKAKPAKPPAKKPRTSKPCAKPKSSAVSESAPSVVASTPASGVGAEDLDLFGSEEDIPEAATSPPGPPPGGPKIHPPAGQAIPPAGPKAHPGVPLDGPCTPTSETVTPALLTEPMPPQIVTTTPPASSPAAASQSHVPSPGLAPASLDPMDVNSNRSRLRDLLLSRLSSESLHDVHRYLYSCTALSIHLGYSGMKVATGCAGSDAPVWILDNLAEGLLGVKFEHTFSCEVDPRKRDWIQTTNPALPALYSDIRQMGEYHRVNLVTNRLDHVDSAMIWVVGFSCTSISNENNASSLFKSCINDFTGATGETFKGVLMYVTKHRPSMVLMENVPTIMGTNLDAVAHAFNELGCTI